MRVAAAISESSCSPGFLVVVDFLHGRVTWLFAMASFCGGHSSPTQLSPSRRLCTIAESRAGTDRRASPPVPPAVPNRGNSRNRKSEKQYDCRHRNSSQVHASSKARSANQSAGTSICAVRRSWRRAGLPAQPAARHPVEAAFEKSGGDAIASKPSSNSTSVSLRGGRYSEHRPG